MAPFDRRDNEPQDAWEAFCLYRDAVPYQTPDRLAAHYGQSATLYRHWSAEYQWPARRESWHMHLDRIGRETAAQTVREVAREHARAWALLRGFAVDYILRCITEGLPVSEKGFAAVTAALAKAIEGERLAAGSATARVEFAGAPLDSLATLEAEVTAVQALPPGPVREAAEGALRARVEALRAPGLEGQN
jgi:hypothetical protein